MSVINKCTTFCIKIKKKNCTSLNQSGAEAVLMLVFTDKTN